MYVLYEKDKVIECSQQSDLMCHMVPFSAGSGTLPFSQCNMIVTGAVHGLSGRGPQPQVLTTYRTIGVVAEC